jgi:hypothetical protein
MSSLGFLSGKDFHPATKQNQKRVWEAEQRERERLEKASQRQDVLKEERKEALDRADPDHKLSRKEQQQLRDLHSVSFMYRAPPGFQTRQENEDEAEKKTDDKALTFVLLVYSAAFGTLTSRAQAKGEVSRAEECSSCRRLCEEARPPRQYARQSSSQCEMYALPGLGPQERRKVSSSSSSIRSGLSSPINRRPGTESVH